MDWENLPDRTGLFSNVVPVMESLLPNGGEGKTSSSTLENLHSLADNMCA
jgi:hypothetical protein